jgi:hypothetical protein
MPDPAPDDFLVRRVKALHKRLAITQLTGRGLDVTPDRLQLSLKRGTVSIVETTVDGKLIRIITTNNSTYYKLLKESAHNLLLPGEVLGSRPTLVYGPKEPGKKSPPRQTIHAEQLGVNDAVLMGGERGRIATSNPGCDRQCISLLNDEFPTFTHVNPANTAPDATVPRGSSAAGPLTTAAEARATSAKGSKATPAAERVDAPSAPSLPRVAPTTAPDVGPVDVRTRGARLAERAERGLSRVRIGFGADLLITIATEIMLRVLEAKLARVNNEGIQRQYRSKVYNAHLKRIIDETVGQVRSGIFAEAAGKLRSQWIYLVYQYDILMERQAEDLSDAIISIIRGFDFVEVFHDLVFVGSPDALVASGPLKRVIDVDKRRQIREDIFRYRYTHKLVLWDPEAAGLFYTLRDTRAKLLALLAETMKRVVPKTENIPWVTAYSVELANLIDRYQFRTAYRLLLGQYPGFTRLPKIPNQAIRDLLEFMEALRTADLLLDTPSSWAEDRRMILTFYLDVDVFGPRSGLIRAEQEAIKRIREAERAIGERERQVRTGTVETPAYSETVGTEQRRWK